MNRRRVQMAIVKSTNKKTGITYVYESESYWDPEKKQPRNRRKLVGKLDENGNIIPTGSRGRKRKEENEPDVRELKLTDELESSLSYYQEKSRELETKNALLQAQIKKLEKEKDELLSGIKGILEKYQKN
jgi:hypothetical protein